MNSPSINIKTLRRLSAFALNRATNDFRSELYEYLVMMALHENPEPPMIKQDIISSIENDLKVEKFPKILIEHAISRLKEKRFIESVHTKSGEAYFLTQDKKTKFNLMKEQYSQTVSRVRRKLAEKIEKAANVSLDSLKESSIFDNFFTFLGEVLAKFGAECCFTILGSHGTDISVFTPTNVRDTLDDILLIKEEERLRDIEKQVFIEYLSNPDDDLSDYLYSLAQSYFIMQILHLDPECQACTRESLRRKRVYIDTNVIVHSLAGVDRRNKAADMALKLTKELQIEIRFSKRTKEEFMRLVEDSRRAFGKDPEVPIDRFRKIHSILEDGFLKDFIQKKSENPNLTYERYADRLEEIEAILKNRYGVIFDSNTYDDIYKNSDFQQLQQIVIDEGIPFGLFKTPSVGAHDAFHILLIQEFRKSEKGDVLGPSYWFLTHDRSLSFVEKRFGKYEKLPSSIFLDNWVELISPLLAPEHTKSARDAYVSLFASRLPLLTKTIKEENFLALQGKWMDDEDLNPEDVARIIGNRYITDYLEETREEKKEISRDEVEIAIQPVIAEIKSGKKEVAELKKEIESLRQTTGELQVKSTDLEQKVTKYETIITKYRNITEKFGYFVSAVFFLGLWYLLYQFVLSPKIEAWLALIGAAVLSAITGYLAGFRGYRFLVDRILRYSSK